MSTLDAVLDKANELSYQEREMLLEILRKRQIEERREEIAKIASQAKDDFHSGKLTSYSDVETMLRDLQAE
ncbi:MAG: hypothetical protein AB1600_08555 [Bacteroidota bacterium]